MSTVRSAHKLLTQYTLKAKRVFLKTNIVDQRARKWSGFMKVSSIELALLKKKEKRRKVDF